MKTPLVLATLCIIAASAANAYNPGRASGYDRSNNNNREMFRVDDSARRMPQDFTREGNRNQFERDIERPADDEQRRMQRDFYDNQQQQEPRNSGGKKKPRQI